MVDRLLNLALVGGEPILGAMRKVHAKPFLSKRNQYGIWVSLQSVSMDQPINLSPVKLRQSKSINFSR